MLTGSGPSWAKIGLHSKTCFCKRIPGGRPDMSTVSASRETAEGHRDASSPPKRQQETPARRRNAFEPLSAGATPRWPCGRSQQQSARTNSRDNTRPAPTPCASRRWAGAPYAHAGAAQTPPNLRDVARNRSTEPPSPLGSGCPSRYARRPVGPKRHATPRHRRTPWGLPQDLPQKAALVMPPLASAPPADGTWLPRCVAEPRAEGDATGCRRRPRTPKTMARASP